MNLITASKGVADRKNKHRFQLQLLETSEQPSKQAGLGIL
jgi:hypothetical protein